MSDRKVRRIYCPVCKKRVVPKWETEDPYAERVYDDPELAPWGFQFVPFAVCN